MSESPFANSETKCLKILKKEFKTLTWIWIWIEQLIKWTFTCFLIFHKLSKAFSINCLTFFLNSWGLSLNWTDASTLAGELMLGSLSIDTMDMRTSSGVSTGLHFVSGGSWSFIWSYPGACKILMQTLPSVYTTIKSWFTVGVPHLCFKPEDRRVVGVIVRKIHLCLEISSFEHGFRRTSKPNVPLKYTILFKSEWNSVDSFRFLKLFILLAEKSYCEIVTLVHFKII